ncbi:outer membrane protein [Rhizobium paknamense]|uniref:Outer membrane immunogenic protein n=1 Tax=Rhizobium paknamense TaxID=1206817 RepID=A0ABU0IAN4_9HYPH|nr:outer membrane protein [Rhizobium paknamense]MDQ0454733.1 outer membrane immunogenic protein [Rhizobium paknamense]
MTTKLILASAAAAAALWSSTAFAADAVSEPPAPPPVATDTAPPAFSWAGGYAGIHGGYSWLNGDFSGGGSETFDGGRFGGFGGWNFDVGNNVILGLEGDVNYDWNKKNFVSGVDFGSEFSGSARGRVGYALDRTLIYAAGGWTATRAGFSGAVDDKATLNGWTIGAGVDYAVTDKIFVRGEYRYNDFGSKTISGVNTDLDQHVINVGVGVKF